MSHLLDTNIVIYALDKNERILKLIQGFEEDYLSISAITYLEIFIGALKKGHSVAQMTDHLSSFKIIPFDDQIAQEAGRFYHQAKKKLRFNDLIIAATAKAYDKTLVTADKDFRNLKGIQVKYTKV